jgi:hypothetical protein
MRTRIALAVLLTAGAFSTFAAAPAHAAELKGYGMALYEGRPQPDNAAPANTTITRVATGRYRVVFPGSAAAHGIVHVAAINPRPVWCQVLTFGVSGADEAIAVGCYRAGGVPVDTNFSISFNGSTGNPPPAPELGKFGYVDARADGSLVTAYNSFGLRNTVTPAGTGAYRVRLSGLGSATGVRRGGLMVNAVNLSSPVRCKVAYWTTTSAAQDVLVVCHDPAGIRTDTRFTLTFHDQPRWGDQFPWPQFGYVWRQGPTGSDQTNFNSVLGPGGIRVNNSPTGQPTVELPQLVATPDTVQLAAFGASADFCTIVDRWVHAGIATFVPGIRCYTTAGAPSEPSFLLWYGNNPN